MKTLFIYDETGKIFNMTTGNFSVPKGLTHIIEEMPENSYPIKVNVEAEEHFVEYGKHELSQIDIVLQALQEQQFALMDIAELINDIIMKDGE